MNEKYPIIKFGAFTYMHKIKKIIFRDNIPILLNNVIDFSEAQDKSIVGWYSDTRNTLYIAPAYGNKIIANQDSGCMFKCCLNLEKIIGLSILDTSNVKSMSYMFSGCIRLKELDVSSFNTSNVLSMSHMFEWCTDLRKLDLSAFDTSHVIYMEEMFDYCRNIRELYLSNFNTSSVRLMESMFRDCLKLKKLNLKNFDISNVISMRNMFRNCENLEVVYKPKNFYEYANKIYTENMFDGCTKIKCV